MTTDVNANKRLGESPATRAIDATILDEPLRLLSRFAQETARPQPLHYIAGQSRPLYVCPDCGENDVRELQAKEPRSNMLLCAATEMIAADFAVACRGCGGLLEHSLTPAGMRHELSLFRDDMPEADGASRYPELAYVVSAVLAAAQKDPALTRVELEVAHELGLAAVDAIEGVLGIDLRARPSA